RAASWPRGADPDRRADSLVRRALAGRGALDSRRHAGSGVGDESSPGRHLPLVQDPESVSRSDLADLAPGSIIQGILRTVRHRRIRRVLQENPGLLGRRQIRAPGDRTSLVGFHGEDLSVLAQPGSETQLLPVHGPKARLSFQWNNFVLMEKDFFRAPR